MIKIRFNLSAGKNYMHWQVKLSDGSVIYYDPNLISLTLGNCTLKNSKKTAAKIYGGNEKSVCAYVKCDYYMVTNVDDIDLSNKISYNPRVKPNWVYNGEDADNQNFRCIITYKNSLYVN